MERWKRWISAFLTLALLLGIPAIPAAAKEVPAERLDLTETTETEPAAELLPPEPVTKVWVNPLYDSAAAPASVSITQPEGVPITDLEQLSQMLREAMLKRESEVSVQYSVPVEEGDMAKLDAQLDEAFARATEHTGVPTEGDYLRYHCLSYGQSIWTMDEDGMRHFTITYTLGFGTTAEQEAEMDEAVARLLSELNPTGTDYEKLCTIYDYITKNIRYDYSNLNNHDYQLKYTAYAALINKTAVCQGYATLLYRLALEVGLDCRVIAGTSNGCPHGWNIVKLGSRYYNLDPTWDEGKNEYDYFLKCEDTFPGHLRDVEYRTVSFHTKYPMALEDYIIEVEPEPEDPGQQEKPDVSGTCGEDVTWVLNRNTGVLTISGTGSMADYEDPYGISNDISPWEEYSEEIKQLVIAEGITHIANYAFVSCKNLTDVSLPDSLESIGDYAFRSCGLTELNLPENLILLGEGVFMGNNKLTSVVIPDKITELVGTFSDCTKLSSVILPEGLTKIDVSAFYGCNLSGIDIPDSVTYIGGAAFGYNNRLTSVTFPEKVAYLGNYVFRWSDNLTTISFTGDAPEIEAETFAWIKATVYYPADNPTWTEDVLQKYGAKSITWVPYENGGLASGTCGDTMTWSLAADGTLTISGEGDMYDYGYRMEAGDYAPWHDYHLSISSVKIASGVRKIGSLAFAECIAMKTAEIPETVTKIGAYGFWGCEALDKIVLPEAMAELSVRLFHGCKNLKEVILPPNLTEIADEAFAYCPNLKKITLPDTVKRIGEGAFWQCHALEEMKLPEGLEAIDDKAFAVCINLKRINLPDSLTKLGRDAFATCESMTSFTIPDGVTEIPFEAFTNCRSLLSITLGKHTQIIDTWAFDGCSNLTSISIPASVKTIGLGAFRNCTALKAVNFEGNAPEFSRMTPEDTYVDESDAFLTVTAAAYYPKGGVGWTEEIMGSYGGSLTWVPYETEHIHSYNAYITAPTCTEQGCTIYTCECGDSYVDSYTAAAGHTTGQWKSDAQQHWQECTVCGETLDTGDHDSDPCTICGYEAPGEDAHDYRLGDVNHDGKINAKDATLILQKSVGVLKETAKFCEECAEVSGDGKLNAKDSTLILQVVVGLRDSFPGRK